MKKNVTALSSLRMARLKETGALGISLAKASDGGASNTAAARRRRHAAAAFPEASLIRRRRMLRLALRPLLPPAADGYSAAGRSLSSVLPFVLILYFRVFLESEQNTAE